MTKTATSRELTALTCPVCFSDRLDVISARMKKCESCGFIWNHEVSDRDNLLLIVEHQKRWEQTMRENPPPKLKVLRGKRTSKKRKTTH